MKIYIVTDIEGVSGVNGRSDGVGNKIINTEASCRLLTEEVNAVVEGLVEGGAKEIMVLDGHGGSNSIHIESLHPAAELLIMGGDLAPITFIDASYDAAVQLGFHAMMGTRDGALHHSYNSHAISNMWLNNELIGEIGSVALQCAYFGVPTILTSGDLAACREAKEFFEKIETVETKKAFSRYSVHNYNPAKVREELRSAAKKALLAKDSFSLKKLNGPYELKLQLMCPNMADNYEKTGAERLDHSTVLLKSDDLLDVFAQRIGWGAGVHNRKFNIFQ
jgi:D-amino peptidase